MASVNGTRLFYQVRGQGKDVVLVHGGQLDCRVWDDQFESYAKSYRVLRYDLRGYGASARRIDKQPYSDYKDLAALLDHMNLKEVRLIGLSLGSRVAVDLAITHPDRVASLVLAGPGLTGYMVPDPPSFAEADRAIQEAAAKSDGLGAARAWLKHPYMIPAMEKTPLGERIRRIAEENADIWLQDEGLEEFAQPPAAERLGCVKVPTLIIVGERDVRPSQMAADALERGDPDKKVQGIPGAKKTVIPDAGHMVNMENPKAFDDAVMNFLK
jgi:pimeloyl-ACP methyl ester carboxylesterase